MDKIKKALGRLTSKEKEVIASILKLLHGGHFENLDIKKLKGRNDIFRARKGKYRIIYRLDKNMNMFILAIERRSDKTYNDL